MPRHVPHPLGVGELEASGDKCITLTHLRSVDAYCARSRHGNCSIQDCPQCSTTRLLHKTSVVLRRKSTNRKIRASGLRAISSLHGPITMLNAATDQELQCFEFFQLHTVPQLCGVFESSFWDRLILQTIQHQPAMRHAAIALGSVHMVFEQNLLAAREEAHYKFASDQYSKAIRYLIQDQCLQSADLALMTCVLFICFEILRGYTSVAFSHIDGGVKILSEMQSNINSSEQHWTLPPHRYAYAETMRPIFDRLEAQMSLIRLSTRKLIMSTAREEASSLAMTKSEGFSSLDEARNSMEAIWSIHAHYIDRLSPSCKSLGELALLVNNSKLSAMHRFSKWSEQLENLLKQTRMQVDKASQVKIHILKVQKILASILFSVDYATALVDETVWDNYFLEYKAINDHAASVVKSCNNVSRARKANLTFTLDPGIIFPLYIVATKCRHKGVRWEAITILRSAPRQEGLLNSILTAHIVEQLVKIEEEGVPAAELYEEIPRFARVACVRFDFDPDRKRALLKYEKWDDSQCTARSSIEKWVHW